MIPDTAAAVRFAAKIDVTESGCVVWTGSRTKNGYGRVRVNYERFMAHRFAYEQIVGPIPDGADLDHLCRVPACVNVLHLEPVTRQENIRRGIRYLTGVCVRGHSVEEHGYLNKVGRRRCRMCERLRVMNSKRKKRGLPPLDRHPSEQAA